MHSCVNTQGRKPAVVASETPRAMKRERRRKVHSGIIPHQSSSIVTIDTSSRTLSEGWKPKPYTSEEGDAEPVYISSGKSTPEPPSQAGIKRKRHHLHHGTVLSSGSQVKKQKRSSVESRTVSVTRLSVPICEDSSAEEMETSRDSSVGDVSTSKSGLMCIREEGNIHEEKRPRSLRVSLSIPDDVEPGTPFDKVVKAHQRVNSPHLSVEAKELPTWENFANSTVLKTTLPKQRPQTLTSEKSSILHPKGTTLVTEASSKSSSQSPSAFLASPLPINTTPKLHVENTLGTVKSSAPATDVITSSNLHSSPLDVGVKGPSPIIASSPAAVGYSPPLAPDVGGIATRPSTLVVKTSQPKVQPSIQPPQRNVHLSKQPQEATPSRITTAHTRSAPGITQASTKPPLSLATKPVTSPSVGGSVQSPKTIVGTPAISVPLKQAVPTHSQTQPGLPPAPPTSATQRVLVAPSQPPSLPTQQVVVTPSRPPSLPTQQVLKAPSQPPSVPTQQVVASRPPTQQVLKAPSRPASVPTQQVLTAPPRPSSVPTQQVLTAPPRPSSVPTQQVLTAPPRPSSVPTQQVVVTPNVPTQQVLVTPPRPASVPTQKHVLVAQSQPPGSTPLQHVLVTQSQSPTPSAQVQQVVVTQPQYLGGKGPMSSTLYHTYPSAQSTPALALSVCQSNGAVPQTQGQVKKPSIQPSDADVIITGVESNKVTQGPNISGAVPQGERIMLLSSPVNEAIAYQTTAMGTAGRKVVAKTVVSYLRVCVVT